MNQEIHEPAKKSKLGRTPSLNSPTPKEAPTKSELPPRRSPLRLLKPRRQDREEQLQLMELLETEEEAVEASGGSPRGQTGSNGEIVVDLSLSPSLKPMTHVLIVEIDLEHYF